MKDIHPCYYLIVEALVELSQLVEEHPEDNCYWEDNPGSHRWEDNHLEDIHRLLFHRCCKLVLVKDLLHHRVQEDMLDKGLGAVDRDNHRPLLMVVPLQWDID